MMMVRMWKIEVTKLSIGKVAGHYDDNDIEANQVQVQKFFEES